MGAVQTKNSTSFFKTPTREPPFVKYDDDFEDTKDPRSPGINRTPLNELNCDTPQNTLSLKDRFMKTINMIDPRSPSEFINRTPIVFNDEENESKNINLNDTFSDLFSSEQFDDKKSTNVLNESASNNEKDPRSPSIEIHRTPITLADEVDIFADDNQDENDMLESVLDALRLNEVSKPKNKQLERIKNPQKKRKARSCNKRKENIPLIYQDSDAMFTTPKKSTTKNIDTTPYKRTPLGCVANRSHLRLRSKSLENSKQKNVAPLTSYDDYNLKQLKVHDNANQFNDSMNNFLV